MIRLKRVYELPTPEDGRRFLVDRLWPRGMKKETARLDGWLKDVAPGDELRRWFGHDRARWDEFQARYVAQLSQKREVLKPLLEAAKGGNVTLLYAARDSEHNNAVVLRDYLEKQMEAEQ